MSPTTILSRLALAGAVAAVLGMAPGVHAQIYNVRIPLHGAASADGTTPPVDETFGPVSLSIGALDFGNINVGDSVQRSLQVNNEGTNRAQVLSISTDHAAFEAAHNCPVELAPGASCVVEVTAQPTGTGNLSQLLLVTDSLGTRSATLLASVGAPSLALSGDGAFPVTQLGSSISRNFTVSNSGTGLLDITSISIAGDDSFAVAGGSCSVGTTLAAAATCDVQVSVTPEGAGLLTGSLAVGASGQSASRALSVEVPNPETMSVTTLSASLSSVEVGGHPVVLTATVEDADGRRMGAGHSVLWGTTEGSLSAAQTATDGNGQATVTLTSPTLVGSATVSARINPADAPRTASVSFTPDVSSAQVQQFVPSHETAWANNVNAVLLQATVRDVFGNVVPGVTVTYTLNSGTLASATAVSQANGVATTSFLPPRILARQSTGGVSSVATASAKTAIMPSAVTTSVTLRHFYLLSDFQVKAGGECVGLTTFQGDAVLSVPRFDIAYTYFNTTTGLSYSRNTFWVGNDGCTGPGAGISMSGANRDLVVTLPSGQTLAYKTGGTGPLAINPVW